MSPGHVAIGIKTSPQEVDWPTLEAAWERIGAHDVFESVWMNDHLVDPRAERGGASWESLTTAAILARHVPGRWIGHGVISNTFRHPAVLAKTATLLDHATGGRFIVGLGAGWHDAEHEPFGIPLPPIRERFDRFESAVHVLRALFSEEATRLPGVTRPDPFYPLDGATNQPGPLTPGGPQLWLGGQKRRGIALAARVAQGWLLPALVPEPGFDDLDYFSEKRAALLEAMAAIGRDPSGFQFAAQIPSGTDAAGRRTAVVRGLEAARRGATTIILGMPPRLGAAGVDAVAREVAQPLREALG